MSALARAGVDLSGQTGPLAELPVGVNGYVGGANRLIFVSSYLWVVLAAMAVIRRCPESHWHEARRLPAHGDRS